MSEFYRIQCKFQLDTAAIRMYRYVFFKYFQRAWVAILCSVNICEIFEEIFHAHAKLQIAWISIEMIGFQKINGKCDCTYRVKFTIFRGNGPELLAIASKGVKVRLVSMVSTDRLCCQEQGIFLN